jgi:hypothetical protein
MYCNECKFYDSSPLWNRCDLTDQECFYCYYDLVPCPFINDNYIFKENFKELDFIKGESANAYMEITNDTNN